jgi:hypothetical protein
MHRIDLGAFGAFDYDANARRLGMQRAPECPEWLPELVYGPALLYALADQRVYAVHASALRLGPAPTAPAIALIAPSGTGKSTLARAALSLGWTRLADDVLPLALGADGIEMRPRFPQLKLDAAEQYPSDAAARLPLAGLVLLERGIRTAVQPLSARAAADLILRSTLASRLLPQPWLAEHLEFVGAICTAVAAGDLRAARLCVAEDDADPTAAAVAALQLLQAEWAA